MADTTPTPGSDAALDKGCRCPVLDNGHGRGIWATDSFWIFANCPLHGFVDAVEVSAEARADGRARPGGTTDGAT